MKVLGHKIGVSKTTALVFNCDVYIRIVYIPSCVAISWMSSSDSFLHGTAEVTNSTQRVGR